MGTKYKGTKKDKLTLDTFIKLVRCTESVSVSASKVLENAGLSISKFDVLELLYHVGPMCQRDIAKKIRKSTGNITFVIDALEKQNYVKRCPSPTDRRYYTIELTTEGNAYIQSLFPLYLGALNGVFDILSVDEKNMLCNVCRVLGKQERM
ncbi:MAG: MarR family transcriptional regulator [Candidatus Riflemargulisbacteria bacterium]